MTQRRFENSPNQFPSGGEEVTVCDWYAMTDIPEISAQRRDGYDPITGLLE
jgi:hypothetical protein